VPVSSGSSPSASDAVPIAASAPGGTRNPDPLGVGHHELRLVGRHRARRPPSRRFLSSSARSGATANQPFRRGDAALRASWGAMTFAAIPRRSAVGHLLPLSVAPTQNVRSGRSFKEPSPLGRLCGRTYFTVFASVLVHRPRSDLATMPRPCEDPWRRKVYGFFAMGWRGFQSCLAQLRARLL